MQGCRGWPPAGPSRPQRPSCFPGTTRAAAAPGAAPRRPPSFLPHQETHQDSVERRWRPSPLHVSQHGGAGVKAQPVGHQLEESNIQLLPPHLFPRCSGECRFNRTDLLDLLGCDRFAVSGYGALGHDDHVETRAPGSLLQRQSVRFFAQAELQTWRIPEQATFRHSYVCQPPAQVVLPALLWGHLRDEDPVGSAGLGRHQGQVPAAI